MIPPTPNPADPWGPPLTPREELEMMASTLERIATGELDVSDVHWNDMGRVLRRIAAESLELEQPAAITDEMRAHGFGEHESLEQPDGWMIQHHRAGSTLCFGPFNTRAGADEWYETTGKLAGVSPMLVPLFLTVDWSR